MLTESAQLLPLLPPGSVNLKGMLTAYLALGANLPSPAGLPGATLAAAADRLAKLGRITARSSLYSTAPAGLADQPRYLNAVVALETELGPLALLSDLLNIELEFGRDREGVPSNAPRTLDLDILFYGDVVLALSDLDLPHPRFAERDFVLIPLNEIASELRDPRSQNTVAQLLQNLPTNPAQNAVVAVQSDLWPAK